MRFDTYYKKLSKPERTAFSLSADTSAAYIENHLMAKPCRRRLPRPQLIKSLSAASNKVCSVSDLLEFFYEEILSEDKDT